MAGAGGPPGPRSGRRDCRGVSRTSGILLVAVALVVVLASFAAYAFENRPGGPWRPYMVHVNDVRWTEPNLTFPTTAGFTVAAGTVVPVSVTMTCPPGPVACSWGSYQIVTPGFGNAGAQDGGPWTTGNSTLQLLVVTPSSAYSGDLSIALTAYLGGG